MQKNALIILIALAFVLPPGAFSQQRIMDMEIVISQPSVGEIVQSGDQIPFTVYLKNNGPDPLVEGDTLFCQLPDGSGQMLLLPQALEAGDSSVVFDTELILTAESSATIDLCFLVIADPNNEAILDGEPVNVSYRDTNPANNMMCHNVIVESEEDGPSSIAENSLTTSRLSVYPNPAANIIHVSAESYPPGDFSIKVVDVSGRVIMEVQYPSGSKVNGPIDLDISSLKAGIYMVQLSGADGLTRASKFIVSGTH